MAAGDDLKIRELHLKGHGSPPHSRAFAIAPDLVDERLELGLHLGENRQIAWESVFGAD